MSLLLCGILADNLFVSSLCSTVRSAISHIPVDFTDVAAKKELSYLIDRYIEVCVP